MNIGIFTDTYSPQISGVATSIKIMEKELRKRGHNVYIFTTTDPNADRESEKGRVFRMPSIPFLFFPERRIAVAGVNKFIKLVGQLDLDIIHTHTEFSLGLLGKKIAKKYDIPSVHTYHTMYINYLHYIAKGKILTPAMVKRMTKSFCESYDAVITPTLKVKHHLEDCRVHKWMYTIPTGTDLSSFLHGDNYDDIRALKEEIGLDVDAPVVLSLGRVAQEKNIDAVIKAFPDVLADIPNAKLVIVGDGPVRRDLQELTEKLGMGENILFTGAVEWEKISSYYQLADVFVSASTTETQGLTYAEAMASRLPVVAKQDESIEGFLTDGETAALFKEDNEIAAVIKHVLQDATFKEHIAGSGLDKVQELSADKFGTNIESAYIETAKLHVAKNKISAIRERSTILKSKLASRVFSLSSSTSVKQKERSRSRD